MATFKLTNAKKEQYLQQIRQGMRRGAATDIVFGEQDPKLRRQMREYIEEDAEFEKAVLDAEVEATEHVEEALYQAAVSGSVAAAKTWLEMNGREFAERRGRPKSGDDGSTDPSKEGDGDPFADLENVRPFRRQT